MSSSSSPFIIMMENATAPSPGLSNSSNETATSYQGSFFSITFDQILLVMQLAQLFVGFFGNAFSLCILLLFRHFLAHPFWFYLVALCTIDLFGCATFLIKIEPPFDFYHVKLYKEGHINDLLEQWFLVMVRDLSAWLIVFIAIERWKSVCWNHDRPPHHRYSQSYQNHHQWTPPHRSSGQVSTTTTSVSNGPSHPQLGLFGFASFKRRTAQLETFFIVTGALMIVNAAHYFANANLWGDAEKMAVLTNNTMAGNGTTLRPAYVQPPRARSTESHLADQWVKVWPLLRELKRCWLPALILLILNCWIVVHTIRFLWNSPPLHLITGRRFGFRRLTSTSASISSPTTPVAAGSTTPPQIPLTPPQQQQQQQAQQASIVYHKSQSLRRRRLVFAWLTLLALPTVFIAFTLPISLFNVLNEFHLIEPPNSKEEYDFLVRIECIMDWLADCNHTINCFIYCLTIARFRMAIKMAFVRSFLFFKNNICKCFAILMKKETIEDVESRDQQCELVMFLERARQARRCRNAMKRRFVVGVHENVEAISDFQQQRHLAAILGIRRASGMESGIAFDKNAQFHD